MEKSNEKNNEENFSKENEDLLVLLKKNLEIAEKNQKDIVYIKKFVIWTQIWGAIKVFLIIIPIVLGFLYLPTFLDKWLGAYQNILGGEVVPNSVENNGKLMDNLINGL